MQRPRYLVKTKLFMSEEAINSSKRFSISGLPPDPPRPASKESDVDPVEQAHQNADCKKPSCREDHDEHRSEINDRDSPKRALSEQFPEKTYNNKREEKPQPHAKAVEGMKELPCSCSQRALPSKV